ncbi:MAG TPA: ABC transporter ATP-binding protein/permease, partial [Pyrinomonadaceae bacterium]|nr:ABC transporter ATP-binding protein/permease [Pyrinomonadaceae bacterium]
NGARISGRRPVQPQDVVQIGSFLFQADPMSGVFVFDTRSKIRIDAIDITRVERNRSGPGTILLLDDVDLTIQPNEFVGLIGTSGAGKSTLMNALNGMRPMTIGRVLINNLDLYQHLDSLKQSIGYVPQEDIIHRELTVQRTLYYVARLRLSRDVPKQEIDQIIGQVLDVTGLTERRDVPVAQLSGGQRKRVSIAVELITKPSVIFLDEPTSGLDPATEDKIMKLFRQIAESGHTVILTTHAMENVSLFDKIVVLMRGKLIFYGTPAEGLEFVGASSFKDLYDKLEAPIENHMNRMLPLSPKASREQKRAYEENRNQIAEAVAEDWRRRFHETPIYKRNIVEPLSGLERGGKTTPISHRRRGIIDSVRQWATLTTRYSEIFATDKTNLLILLAQAPLVGLFTYLVVSSDAPRDFPFFVLALVAIWFGASVTAREIVKERPVYRRERMVNLGLLPYLGSKLFVLSLIVGVQCILLFGILKLLHFANLMSLPGILLGIPQLAIVVLTGIVGVALGLFISAIVRSSEMATSLVPLILIPQILFCGLVGVPQGIAKVVGTVMPATWAFDELKRLSALDTLHAEGATDRLGLYKRIEETNEENIARARSDVEDYRRSVSDDLEEYREQMQKHLAARAAGIESAPPAAPVIGPPPSIPEAEVLSEDLSDYVSFKHPWGHVLLNAIILLVMLFVLVLMTLISLRMKDVR